MINQKRRNRAFTLMEIMVSVVIIGILAGFGIPSYTKSVRRAEEKDAVFNLRMIKEAVRMYTVRNGTIPSDLNDIAAINAELNLSIIRQENTYYCLSINPATGEYRCEALSNDNWDVGFDLATNNEEVRCSSLPADACPTCNATGSSCPK